MSKVDMTDTYWFARKAERGPYCFHCGIRDCSAKIARRHRRRRWNRSGGGTESEGPGEGRQLEIDRPLPSAARLPVAKAPLIKNRRFKKKISGKPETSTRYELQFDQR